VRVRRSDCQCSRHLGRFDHDSNVASLFD
jgi:hypothetical protein